MKLQDGRALSDLFSRRSLTCVAERAVASGIVNTSQRVGSALGLAATITLATSQGADQLGNPQALTDGLSAAFLAAAAIAAAGAPHRLAPPSSVLLRWRCR